MEQYGGQRRWLVAGGLVLVAMIAITVAWQYGINPRAWSPQVIQQWILSFGPWAPVIYVGVCALVRPFIWMLLPFTFMVLAGGLAFGRFWGTVWTLAGGLLCGILEFLIARYVGRQMVERHLRGRLARIDASAGRHGFATVLLLRIIPNVPYDLLNYSLGLSPVGFRAYTLATALGLVPWVVLYTCIGAALTSTRQLWQLAGLILLIIAVVWLPRWLWQRRPVGATEMAGNDRIRPAA
ncbi:MAG: TVP38/TMEM64 family protein [Candidatus Omnitrophica bacterium]|nr:TVP38/TMEM64 family protein [Candidatus Omnitrophota bacterium]